MNVLSESQINDLLGSGRIRGLYVAQLKEFAESGEVAIQVSLEEGRFTGKSPDTVYQGFNGKTGEGSDYETIKCFKRDGQIFLVNMALYGVEVTEASDETETEVQA